MNRIFLSTCLLIVVCFFIAGGPATAQGTGPLLPVNHLGGEANVVVVDGNIVYVSFGPRLAIVDVSNPAQPTQVGFLLLPGRVRDIQIAGRYAYAVTELDGLHIVNVSAPAVPTLIGVYNPPDKSWEVAIAGRYAYLKTEKRFVGGEWVGGGVRAIDVSNPAMPVEVAYFPSEEDESRYVSLVPTTAPGKAYISEMRSRTETTVVDVTNPFAPVDCFSTGNLGEYAYNPLMVGDLAYVTAGGKVYIADISGPFTPTELAVFRHWGDIRQRVIVDDRLHLILGEFSGSSGNVWLVDVSNPKQPELTGSYFIEGQARDMAGSGNYLYVAAGPKGLRVLDVSDPARPVEIGAYQPPVAMTRIARTVGDTAFAYAKTDGQWNLTQFNIADPATPYPVKITLPGAGTDWVIDDAHFHLLKQYNSDGPFSEIRLETYQQTGETPIELGRYSLPASNWPRQGQIVGNYAYLPAGDMGLRVLDISDPATPQEVGAYFNPTLPDELSGETIFGDYTVRSAFLERELQNLLLVYKNDQLIYFQRSDRLGIDKVSRNKTQGTDITGNGIPNLIVSEYTGGAHCCGIDYVFELGETFRLVDIIPTTHSGGKFQDLDGDGIAEFLFNDWHFAYWSTPFAGSPSPGVVMSYQDNAWRPAPELMCQPAPDLGELEAEAAKIRDEGWEADGLPHLLETTLNLIYSGHAGLALDFFDAAWPPEIAGEDEFLTSFAHELATNRYWPELQTLNAGQWSPPFDMPTVESRIEPPAHHPARNIPAVTDGPTGSVRTVAVQGDYAYLGMDANLVILDISDPTTPRRVGDMPLRQPLEDIAVAGSILYLAERSDPFNGGDSAFVRVVDVSEPSAPVEVGAYEVLMSDVGLLKVNGPYLALITRGNWQIPAQLIVLDISNPASPTQAASYPLPLDGGQSSLEGWIDEYIYVTSAQDGTLVFRFPPAGQVAPKTNPAEPLRSNRLNFRRFSPNMMIE